MAISKTMRKELYKTAKGKCECRMRVCTDHTNLKCARGLSPEDWEVRNIISKEEGGKDTLNNLIVLCTICHKKSSMYRSLV